MAKTIKNTEKRTYKHSEAWLKAHAEKLEAKKKLAQNIKKDKSEKKIKKIAKNADVKKSAMKKAKTEKKIKKAEKNPSKKVILKKDKTTKTVNNKTKKNLLKKQMKHDIKDLAKLTSNAKKNISVLKKLLKNMSKAYASAFKLDDDKYLAKIKKTIERIGLNVAVDNASIELKLLTAVKLPKEKKLKKSKKLEENVTITPSLNNNNTDATDMNIDDITTIPSSDEPDALEVSSEPSDEELNDLEKTIENDEDEQLPEGLDEDEKAQLLEDRKMEREYERDCRGESDETINDAMRENGDWD